MHTSLHLIPLIILSHVPPWQFWSSKFLHGVAKSRRPHYIVFPGVHKIQWEWCSLDCAKWWHWYLECIEANSSCNRLDLCVLLKFIHWSPNPFVIVEPSWMGSVLRVLPFTVGGHSENMAICEPGAGPHQTPNLPATWSWTSWTVQHKYLLFVSQTTVYGITLEKLNGLKATPLKWSKLLFQVPQNP